MYTELDNEKLTIKDDENNQRGLNANFLNSASTVSLQKDLGDKKPGSIVLKRGGQTITLLDNNGKTIINNDVWIYSTDGATEYCLNKACVDYTTIFSHMDKSKFEENSNFIRGY